MFERTGISWIISETDSCSQFRQHFARNLRWFPFTKKLQAWVVITIKVSQITFVWRSCSGDVGKIDACSQIHQHFTTFFFCQMHFIEKYKPKTCVQRSAQETFVSKNSS